MAELELTEPVDDVFVLRSEYADRAIPKSAGLRWHPGDRCRRNECFACDNDVGEAWWTRDVLQALELREYAEEALQASLLERARPAIRERAKLHRVEARAAKVRTLTRLRTRTASRAQDATIDVPRPAGREFLPYQRAAIAFGLQRPNVLFADEMGLGKTIEALGVINADPDARRVLIVCPASLKLNWQRECERWLVGEREIGVAGKTFPETADVVIINYDILVKWKHELTRDWDVLVADECHYAKNRDAKRSKALFALAARRKLFLTGTPILNRPVELWALVHALDPEEFPKFQPFAKRYCNPERNRFGWDYSGAANLDELHERLRSTIMVRRTKAEVLTDLPPKRRQVIELASSHVAGLLATETEAWREHQRRSNRLRAVKRGQRGDASEAELAALRAGVNAAFGELAKLRQDSAIAKVPLVVEHLRSLLTETDKVVVFAHHRAVVRELADAFGDAAVTLAGDDSTAARQSAVDRFQTDATCRLFVGSITAAGLGITLTASAHVVFAELDWVPARMTQAEDRTHRIGQTNSVLIQHLVLEGSLDARMVGTLLKKQRVIDRVVDGGESEDLFQGEFAEALQQAEMEALQAQAEAAGDEGA
ncbi:MAG: DEAD/DEAH box helicase [Planctomycetota bacterium]